MWSGQFISGLEHGFPHRHMIKAGCDGLITCETAAFVKADRLRINERSNGFRSSLARKRFSKREQYFAVASTLQILTNGNASKDSELTVDVDTDHSDRFVLVNQDLRIVARAILVWMIFIVDPEETAIFEEHLAANCVIGAPLVVVLR